MRDPWAAAGRCMCLERLVHPGPSRVVGRLPERRLRPQSSVQTWPEVPEAEEQNS
jgi:hypothetical protein